MTKEEPAKKENNAKRTLPPTKAESAEERLEELVKNKSVQQYYAVFEQTQYYYFDTVDGECRVYPEGFEAVIKRGDEYKGQLHVARRNVFITYNLNKEYEKQNIQTME